MDPIKPLVSICCLSYNHEKYLRQCLDGFLMQRTSFPIEVVIHDDASTDKSADIIREYSNKRPDLFHCIIQTENQYSKGGGILGKFVFPRVQGKYIALCEGDDYWIDPNKLQKQVDWLESHEDCSMTCCDAKIITSSGEESWKRYELDCNVPAKDMILGGGLWIQTAGLIYRRSLLANYPDYCSQCHVGDYPLQIFAALNGEVHWFSDKMIAYRFASDNSWTKNNQEKPYTELLNGWISEINMLKGLDTYSKFSYHDVFVSRQVLYINEIMRRYPKEWREIHPYFKDVVKLFSKKQKVMHFLLSHNLYPLYASYVYVKSRI